MPAPPARAPRSAHRGNRQRKSCCRDAVCSVPATRSVGRTARSSTVRSLAACNRWPEPLYLPQHHPQALRSYLPHPPGATVSRSPSLIQLMFGQSGISSGGVSIGRSSVCHIGGATPSGRSSRKSQPSQRHITGPRSSYNTPLSSRNLHDYPPSSLQGGPYGPPFGYPLERNFVRCSFATVNLSGLRIRQRRTKKLHALRDNFGALALAAVVARLVLAGPQASFDVHLAALLQVFLAALRSLAENYDVVPVGTLLALALLVRVRLVGRDRKARHRLTAGGQMPQFRVLAKMADESYSIK